MRRPLLSLLALCIIACVGDITTRAPGSNIDGPGGEVPIGTEPPGPGEPSKVNCSAPLELPPRVRLLDSREWAGAVTALTGVTSGLTLSTRGDSTHVLFSPTAGQVHEALAFELNQKSEAIAAAAAPALAASLPCAGAVTATCIRDFVRSLGSRALRRPLDAAELSKLEGLYALGAEEARPVEAGLALVLEALLQSPSFLNLVQLGGTGGSLSPHETAATLAFLLTEAPADAPLLAAAESGQLSTPEQVRAHVDRLLEGERARTVATSRFGRWLEADGILDVSRAQAELTGTVKSAMRAELNAYLQAATWSGEGSLDGLLSGTRTTVTAPLADWYGLPASSFSGSAALDIALPAERKGVMTLPAFLASHAQFDNSSTVFRGLFINRFLLCRDTGAPPPGAVGSDPKPGSMPRNQREKAELRIANAPCSGCHASFEPFGVLFEHYDAIGRHRTHESGLPVDASWSLKYPNEVAGPTASVLELTPKLAGSAVVRHCVARAFSSVAAARAPSPGVCAPPEVLAAFEGSNGNLRELLRSVAVWAATSPRKESP
ncbi:MAG: DUF1592 domain-containing protein [Myxococcaceae bacterium]|nr:DUF1592 domain-containing protein [Myxococcaceae bacterium]